jgi:hypothetical protein
MIAAAHLDNFLFLLFVAIAIFFQLLTRAATKTRRRTGGDLKRRSTATPETPRMAPPQAEESDEDRIRKFLEALGQPTTSKPPPPVQPRPTYQRPVVFPPPMKSPLPPLTTQPPDLPPQTQTPGQAVTTRERKVSKPRSQPPGFEVHQASPPIAEAEVRAAFRPTAAQPSAKPYELATLLRSPAGLRDAIILREIFGPPRSLQPLDLVGSG